MQTVAAARPFLRVIAAVLWLLVSISPEIRAENAPSKASPKPDDSTTLLHALDRGFVALFDRIAPTVVVIDATRKVTEPTGDERELELLLRDHPDSPGGKPFKHPPIPNQTVRSEGSGFFVRPDGYIVTNLHVVEEANELTILTKDGGRHPAKIIGRDEQTDIAILKIEKPSAAVAELGDSDALRVGQLVCAIGAPFNQRYSFTCGWVSGTGRTNLLGATSDKILLEDYVQTDAFINPGNSGGPLFDVDGRVIGMNTLINGLGRGLAFAIPSNLLTDVIDQLIAQGRVSRSWLGIRMGSVEDSGLVKGKVPEIDKGVVVYTIVANSPAFESDLRPHDIITAVSGRKVALPYELQQVIFRTKVGTTLQLEVWRDGKSITIPVTTHELPTGAKLLAAGASPATPGMDAVEALGLTFEDNAAGECKITAIKPDSPAAKARLAADDIVTGIEAEPKKGAVEIATALSDALGESGEKGVLINFERNGKKNWAVIERPKE